MMQHLSPYNTVIYSQNRLIVENQSSGISPIPQPPYEHCVIGK